MRHDHNTATCGNCGRSWNDKIDPTPSALCPFCHGRGSSKAEVFTDAMREKILFFFVNAGYSYDPKTETARRGRYNCAVVLARAETALIDSGKAVPVWDIDPDIMSNEWIGAEDNYDDGYTKPWNTYCLTLHDADSNEPVGYLGGVDFGRYGTPYNGDSYARVCVAQMAAEHISEFDDDEPEPDNAETVTVNRMDFDLVCEMAALYTDEITTVFPSLNKRVQVRAALERLNS